jgi:diguanylate cyclase (GGDEF) domain
MSREWLKGGIRPKRSRRHSLWRLRLNLIAGAIAIGILALSIQGLWNERQEAWREAEQTSRNLLMTLTRDIGSNVAAIDLVLKGVVEGFSYRGFAKLPPEIQYRILFDRAVSATFTGSILLLDEAGNLIADGGSVLAPRSLNFANDEFFRIHKESPFIGFYVSRPYKSRIRPGELSFAFSRRLSHADGKFNGVVAAEVALDDIHGLLKGLNVGPGGSISLFRNDGTLLMRQPYDESVIGRNLGDTTNVRRFLQEGSGSFEGTAALDQVRRFYTFNRVGEFPLILTVSQSVQDILSAWWRRALVLAVITGVLCSALARLIVLFWRELGRRTKAEAELEQLARSDGLTGLPNRRAFDEFYEREWRQAVRSKSPLSLLFIDVDFFKNYNDHYGHMKGDHVLCAVAATIDRALRRPRDFVARYGGEEFIIVLPETDLAAARALAETIRKAVIDLRIEHELSCFRTATVSIGVAGVGPVQGSSRATLLEAADAALYQAKAAGRNCIRTSEESLPGSLPRPAMRI